MKNKIKKVSRIIDIAIFLFIGALTLSLLALSLPRVASAAESPNADLAFDTEDLDFILAQIKIAERHAAGENLLDILPNASIPWGLRTVDGSFNNLIPGQENFGAADLEFPQLTDRVFPSAQTSIFPPFGPTTYNSAESVTDSTPRLISHLIVNQSIDNPVAVSTADAEGGVNIGPDIAGADQFFIPNTAPDEGLSAPFNAFTTFFGQFFDHGLDLVNKGGNGVVMIPLQSDDPLFDSGPDLDPSTVADNGPNFMALPRATRGPGSDGILGNEDDVFVNATTPHVDQQQTYASHSSSQVLLRHYEFGPCPLVDGPATPPVEGCLQNTGRLLNGFGNDGILDNEDDGGMATWDTAQAQALEKFGIILDDQDGNNVPMIAADQYGNFIPGPARGLPQIVTATGSIEGDLASPVDATQALRVNQNFFIDVAHSANPGPGVPDADSVINPRTDDLSGQVTRGIRANAAPLPGPDGILGTSDDIATYDDELLGTHFVCGDGRCNENIALTTIHTIFHHEHNRLGNVTKRVLLDAGDLATLNEWLDTPLLALPDWPGLAFPVSDASLGNQALTQNAIDALNLDWNGGRIFQAARFGTEMQYNRIVFDEFAPTLAGLKDVFEGFHTNVDPTISAEFSQSVYRFGHSMLTQTVDRYDADFNTITETHSGDDSQLGLFEAFLNPLALLNAGEDGLAVLSPEVATGAVIRGLTRTTANEIDEFVTGALQNNLVGLPLDLGAINIARGRDVGNPPLNVARRMFFTETQDTRLKPYLHWADYADNLRHEASLVNFIAAYGKHPTLAGIDGIVGNADDAAGPDGILGNADDMDTTYAGRRAAACAIVGALSPVQAAGPDGIGGNADDFSPDPTAYCEDNGFGTPPATPVDALDFLFSTGDWFSDPDGSTITGMDNVDFWNGGLAEERMPFGGYLGSTHNYVFETQIEDLQNGDRFYYVGRTANIHFFSELESNSFTALAMRSTDLGESGAGSLSLNIFSVPNHILEVDQSQQFDAAGDGTTADPEGDAELVPLVIRDVDQLTTNIQVSDTTRVIQYTGGDHVTIGGTDGNDTMVGGIGDDTIMGGNGNDRIEGGDGADLIEGGAGDDIITDLSGPDVIEGGAGNDAISSGNEEDVIFGDAGNDFIVNSSEFGEIFGGLGDDYIFDGMHNGHIRGGAGDDWIENLGGGEDLFQGDNGAAAEGGEPAIIGNDVAIGHGGNNDFDMENGDDIVVDGPGIDRVEGQLGFDWVSFQNDRFGVNVDLDLTIFLRPQLPPSNNTILNRYDRVEGISGSPFGDFLRGTDNLGGAEGNELTNFDLIEGLQSLVPLSERGDLPPDIITGEPQFGWADGEIILGGAGSDIMVGEGGDDIMDGDAALRVAIRTPDPAIRTGPLGQALLAAKAEANSTASQADLDAAAAGAFDSLETAALAAIDAADAAVDAAQDAVDAADLAKTGLSGLTITDAIGNLINSATFNTDGTDIKTEWNNFLASCTAALRDLGWDVGATDANKLAEALAEQAAAVLAEAALTQAALNVTALASADAAASAQTDLASAQANLDAAMALGVDETEGTADDGGMILVAGMEDVMDAVFAGFINPGELSISRVISDEDSTVGATDIAAFSGNLADYEVNPVPDANGFIQVTDNRLPPIGDGRDLIRNVERLQFADQTVFISTAGGRPDPNELPIGQPTISGIPEVLNILTASIDGVTDPDNITPDNPTGAVLTTVDWTWESELDPGSGIFTPIVREFGINGNGDPVEATGENLALTVEDSGLRVRVAGLFQDTELVFETVRSASLTIGADPGPGPVPGAELSINRVRFRADKQRLIVEGDVAPFGSSITLFAPGTTTNGVDCTGTLIGGVAVDVDGRFKFDSGNDGFTTGDPGTVCVSSNNGLALSQ